MKCSLIYSFVVAVNFFSTGHAQDGLRSPSKSPSQSSSNQSAYAYLDTANLKPLKIGDKVPDIVFDKMINYKSSNAKLSDFKGKLVILDFCSVYCTVCIKLFPKMEKLQQQYGDKIAILTIGFDANMPGSIEKFVNNRKGTPKEMNLPTAVQSTNIKIMEKLFPFEGLPHEVWIDGEGMLVGITDQFAVAPINIDHLLTDGGTLSIPKLNPRNLSFEDDFLVKSEHVNGERNFNFWGSFFAGYQDSLTCGWPFGLQRDSGFIRFFDINRTLLDFYMEAYKDIKPDLSRKLIVLENVNRYHDWDYDYSGSDHQIDNYEYDSFMNENTFSYELILPKEFGIVNAKKIVVEDFDRFFRVKSEIKKKSIPCIEIISITAPSKLKTQSDKKLISNNQDIEDLVYLLRKVTLDDLARFLNKYLKNKKIIINSAKDKQEIDLDIPLKLLKDESLALDFLRNKGITFAKVNKEIEVLNIMPIY